MGAAFGALAGVEEVEVVGLDRSGLDITDGDAVFRTLEKCMPDIVVNAAAYTAVDCAEDEPELAFRVNRDGAEYVALACSQAGIPLIHLSTDYVFDGRKSEPYFEDDLPNPLGVYGRSKSIKGRGVYGLATNNSGQNYGVYGHANSTAGRGVFGIAVSSSGTTTIPFASANEVSTPEPCGPVSRA